MSEKKANERTGDIVEYLFLNQTMNTLTNRRQICEQNLAHIESIRKMNIAEKKVPTLTPTDTDKKKRLEEELVKINHDFKLVSPRMDEVAERVFKDLEKTVGAKFKTLKVVKQTNKAKNSYIW